MAGGIDLDKAEGLCERPICFSCNHHSVVTDHPSGCEHFCSLCTSAPPKGMTIFPLQCIGHPSSSSLSPESIDRSIEEFKELKEKGSNVS